MHLHLTWPSLAYLSSKIRGRRNKLGVSLQESAEALVGQNIFCILQSASTLSCLSVLVGQELHEPDLLCRWLGLANVMRTAIHDKEGGIIVSVCETEAMHGRAQNVAILNDLAEPLLFLNFLQASVVLCTDERRRSQTKLWPYTSCRTILQSFLEEEGKS